MADRRVTYLINANIQNFEKNLSRAQAKFKQFGQGMKNLGSTMTSRVTLPLGLAGLAAVKLAVDFQTSMRKIQTLVGLAADRVNSMAGDVINLSDQTGEGAKGLADALFVVTSAGQRGAEAMQILERSAKASAIGLGETKETARAVTSILNAYGKENISAAQATDQLVSTVREGNLEAADLAPVLGRVIGMASQLKIPFSEVGASIATFTRLGVSAEEATVGLRGILSSLIKPSAQARDTLAKVGMSFASLRAEVRQKGLAVALIDLMDKFKGNEEAIGEIIPNVRALSAVLGTAGSQAQTYADISKTIASATGLVDEGFQNISQDSGFKFKQTLENLKNVGIEIGAQLLPAVNNFLNVIKRGILWFKNLSTEGKKLAIIFAGLAAAIGPALVVLGSVAIILGSISLPVLGIIAALAALGVAITYVANNWNALKERISDWSWWKNAIIDMIQFLIEWNPVSELIKGFNVLIGFFGKKDLIPNPFEGMADALDGLKSKTGDYKSNFQDLGEFIVDMATKAKNAIVGILPSGGGGTLPTTNVGQVSTAQPLTRYGVTGDPIPPEFSGKLKEIKNVIGDVTGAVFKLGDAMQSTLNTAFADFATTLGNVFTGDAGAQGFFNNLLLIVADFAEQFGKALIAAGVAALAFESLLINPIAAIAAGIALVAASTVAKNLLTKGPKAQGMASGGIVPSGFPNDSYPASLSSGEMVVPSPQALPSFGGDQKLSLTFSLREMVIALDNERKLMNR